METTGLDYHNDDVLEIGCVISTGFSDGLEEITSKSFLIHPSTIDWTFNDLDPVVQQMHTVNGLWNECLAFGHDVDFVECLWSDWLDKNDMDKANMMIGGSGIDRFDCLFVERLWPKVFERFHWRRLDMSPMKYMLDRIGRNDLVPEFSGTAHRAVDDARHALALAQTLQRELGLPV